MTKRIELDEGDISLIVYGREECHLCQEMITALQQLRKRRIFHFQLIDIDFDPQLIARYGEKIPVLVTAQTHQEICHYHLDSTALDAYLDKFR